MIKVNLLESVTDKQTSSVSVVEKKVTNPRTQMLLLVLAFASLAALAMGYEFMSSRSAHESAQNELDKQQRIAAQMAAINKEQSELEKKTKEIQARIDAIQKLRLSQQGPSAVLQAIKERFDNAPNLYLESIEQKGAELVVKGNSPNEVTVTQFGRSLEFSSGLFSNLSIETQRKTMETAASVDTSASASGAAPAPKPETVDFTIKCSYTPTSTSAVNAPNAPAAAPQVAQK